MITSTDVARQVATAIGGVRGPVHEVNIDSVAREIIATHGWIDINCIDQADFWGIVDRHEAIQR